ncbi:uncharacterized protein MONOS_15296 [Monocercomonoides exilis]|uniref:uncharacterized protein n=1 Tax=Monocercomonoides exilis TaxID=2049356 RepID=UPI00355A8F18|nr:hypothetical protein MONOS_15296 [Monocercomonoides exilis]|eukprot:MONOS_15296.1-p1 / transcript=MONOS_15296.1 / gene=MONOS_15296 / organism=Monocercomonoides_exilis_PA203 / gene_product=unspecified product / transcript_product=unspecified product / location=Mono_scaffold01192:13159-14003(-) / protein_length=251 / sequence_SO=supercontig / SO=protein_coding / is_pseudo=false
MTFENGNVRLRRKERCVLVVEECVAIGDELRQIDMQVFQQRRERAEVGSTAVSDIWTCSWGQARLEFVVQELVQCGLYFQIIVRGADGGQRVRTYSFESTGQNTERRGFGRIGRGVIEERGADEEVLANVVYLSEELAVEERRGGEGGVWRTGEETGEDDVSEGKKFNETAAITLERGKEGIGRGQSLLELNGKTIILHIEVSTMCVIVVVITVGFHVRKRRQRKQQDQRLVHPKEMAEEKQKSKVWSGC